MPLRPIRCCLAVLLAWSTESHALAEHCVDTPAAFQEALDQAEVDLDDSLIKVRAGTFDLGSSLRYEPIHEYLLPPGRLTIRGG